MRPAPVFQCYMCGAAAESYCANVRHMMSHVGHYRCMLCGQPFVRAQDLYKHDAEEHDAEPRRACVVVDLTDESGQDEDVGAKQKAAVIAIDLTSDEDGGCGGRPTPGQAEAALRPRSPEADCDPNEPLFMFLQKRMGEQAAAAATPMDVDTALNEGAPVDVAAPVAAPERARPKPCSKCSRPGPASRKKACCCKPVEKPKRRKRKFLYTRSRLGLTRTPSAGRATQLQDRLQVEPRAPAASSPPAPPSPPSPVAADLAMDALQGAQAGRGVEPLRAQAGLKPGPRRQLQVKRRIGPPSKKSKGPGQGKRKYSRTSALMSSGTAPATNGPSAATNRQPGWIDGLVKDFSAPTPLGRKCTFCPRVFKSAGTSNTHRHVMGHLQLHRNKTCLICGKVSSDKVSQMTHKLEHMVTTNYEANPVPNA